VALAVVGAVTLVNQLLLPLLGPRSVALIYLIGVVGLALRLGRGPVYLSAALSALLWNFLFLPPRFTLYIHNIEDMIMFGMYFVVALAMGQLIARIRAKERMDRRREERATALYLLTLELGDAASWDDIERAVVGNVDRVFRAGAALLLPDVESRLYGPFSEKEISTGQWAFDHGKPAGRFTDTLPVAEAMYIPLRTTGAVLGVLRLDWRRETPPTLEQRNLLESFVRHTALILARQRLRDAAADARVLAESERLSRVLLSSISHELRTPIAAIQSAVAALQGEAVAATPPALVAEIGEASERLNRLVGNILDMSRLESGHVKPNLDWCDVTDLVNVTLQRTRGVLSQHVVSAALPPGLPLVRVDFGLLGQALANVLHNAAVHTPVGTAVQVSAEVQGRELLITVADRGPGLPPGSLERVFDKFYRASGAPAGGSGLGLSIARGFVEAQGGRMVAANRTGGGAAFTLALPLVEAPAL
jgi:two-component system sensor histidine kinase KdpD